MDAQVEDLYSIYLIRCANGDLYTGIAKDVRRRLDEHAGGRRGSRFLRGKGPLTLAFSQAIGDRSEASRIEYRLKKLTRADKEALAAGRATLTALLDETPASGDQASGAGGG